LFLFSISLTFHKVENQQNMCCWQLQMNWISLFAVWACSWTTV